MNLDHHLQNQLKTLRLGGILETLDLRAQQAQKDDLGYLEFFQLIVQDEVERREAKKLNLRLSKAAFEEEKTLEGFDFSSTPKLNARLIRDLGNCAFIEKTGTCLALRICRGREDASCPSPRPSSLPSRL